MAGRVPVTGRQACLPGIPDTGQNERCTTGCPVDFLFTVFFTYLYGQGSVVCLSAVLFLCLSVSLEDTQDTETETETETFLYVCTSILLNIPGARVLPGNLSARYTGIRANPIRAPGTVHYVFCYLLCSAHSTNKCMVLRRVRTCLFIACMWSNS